MLEYIIKNIYLFSTAALLSIGSFYDERLVIYEINITLIISILSYVFIFYYVNIPNFDY